MFVAMYVQEASPPATLAWLSVYNALVPNVGFKTVLHSFFNRKRSEACHTTLVGWAPLEILVSLSLAGRS